MNGHINPYYLAQPAPLGLADYGLGASTYSYNTSHAAGSVTFNTPPNVTQPGGTGLVEPSLGGQHLGYVGNLYEFGVQLNTVGINLTIPGTNDQGYVWAQNVVNWNDTGIHFVMDTWNASYLGGFYMAPNSIYSACGTNTAGVNYILSIYGGVLQCVMGTIPITAADYPLTLTLYDNFTTNSQNRSQLVYGYSLTEAGVGTTLSGIADTVVFNNTAPSWQNPSAPPNKPGNAVDGFTTGPAVCPTCGGIGLDSEIVLVGGIGGDNAVFRSVNGSMTLQYSNLSSGGWKNVPSAYNFGGDTGETATGIADYYTAGHTLMINQGPTMLYGLWNAEPQVSVASGDVQLAGTISPSYGFVFVSNTAPVLNPWTGGQRDNMSWLPTTSSGAFSTYLPPFGGAWTSTYYIQAFAAGSAEFNGTVTASTSAYAISLTAAPGVLRAPLYMYTNAQASALAAAVGGSASSPYTFSNLVVDVNFTFDHLNDYGYPSFDVFWAQGVGNPVYVNNTYEGTDSVVSRNSYIFDAGSPSGILTPAPALFLNKGYYTSGINIYNGVGDHVTNQELFPVSGMGSRIILWEDSNALVNATLSLDGGMGVWVGNSHGTSVTKTTSAFGATGVTDIGSTGTTVWNLEVAFGALGIESLSAHSSTYSFVNATLGSEGISAGADYGPSVTSYYYLPGTTGLTVNDLNVTDGSLGANITLSDPTTFNNVAVWDPSGNSLGLALDGDTGVVLNNLVANGSEGLYAWNVVGLTASDMVLEYGAASYLAEIYSSSDVALNGLTVQSPLSFGVLGMNDNVVSVTNSMVGNAFAGVVFEYSSNFSGTNLNSSGSVFAYELDYSSATITVNGVNAQFTYFGLNLYYSYPATVTNVVANQTGGQTIYSAGVASYDTVGNTITGVTATNGSLGVRLDYGTTGSSVSNVAADHESVGVELDSAPGNAVSGVTASNGSLGVDVVDSSQVSVSGVTATNLSLGVEVYESNNVQVDTVAASDISVGVRLYGSQFDSVSSVTATNASLQSPYLDSGYWGPIAAVDTYYTEAVTVSGVTATTYPAGLYDEGSNGLSVSALNATGGWYGLILNDTYNSMFTGIGAYQDYQGMLFQGDARYNSVTGSSFVDETSYGIAIVYGYYNTIWNNNFIGDNGATSTFDPAHLQAFSGDYNYFYICPGSAYYTCSSGIGNYWADWHTYGANGYLAPYVISGVTYDEFPIGPQETFLVSFTETGLAAGTSWSVTLGGVTMTATTAAINFTETMGTYAFQVGNVASYTVSPSSGSVTLGAATYNVPVTFTAVPTPTFAVTLSAGGLTAGTTWSATVNGVTQSTTGPSLVFYLANGNYTYSFNAVNDYNLPSTGASGTVTVSSAPTSVSASYSPKTTPSYVSTDSFNMWLAVAIALAVIALVIGLLAVVLRRGRGGQAQGAQAWSPPPAAGSGGAGASGGWSEGPPAGGSPPS